SFALDVTSREDCVAVARQIADKVGQVSILVNNAGIARRNGMLGAREAVINDWEDIIAINLTGVFNVTHAFLEPLRAAKGRIVNIGSIQSFMHLKTPSSPAYTASKHGVLGFTKALAAELGKDGMRVNATGPAATAPETQPQLPLCDHAGGQSTENRTRLRTKSKIARSTYSNYNMHVILRQFFEKSRLARNRENFACVDRQEI